MSVTKKMAKKAEDQYFAKIEFERRKAKLEEEHKAMKAAEKKKLKEAHWMHCPKCGMELVELDFEGIKIDKCSECLGIYLDDGELNTLLSKKEGVLSRFAKLFTS
ncbi:MAG: zf-TFIIB domain-containing protein [Myxococcales bacterium]|nr:zf-TFIIB domain-containing protein [Myxococcales bacterium]